MNQTYQDLGTDTGRPRRRKSPGRASTGPKDEQLENKIFPRTTPSRAASSRRESPSRRADHEGEEEVNLEDADTGLRSLV